MQVDVGAAIPQQFLDWHRDDVAVADKWRSEVFKPAYAAFAGDAWDPIAKQQAQKELRPALSFNRTAPIVNAVSGQQIANRQEVRFIPREMGDVQVNEVLTAGAEWFRDEAEGDDEDSQAFVDTTIAGMGWTETRIDFEVSDEGAPVIEFIPAEEMLWDAASKRRNLMDARRVWRVRTMPLEMAQDMFDGKTRHELDAAWARPDGGGSSDQPYNADDPRDRSGGRMADGRPNEVTIVQVQWIAKKRVMMMADPMTGQVAEYSPKDFRKLKARYARIGFNLKGTPRTRRVRKQAWLGGVVLDVTDAPCPDHFSFQCVTGQRDRIKGYWYGLVRAMIEPQEWANKWLSQMLHIMNASAKGGLMVESDAADGAGGISQIEDSWAANDAITVVASGSLQSGKVQPKPSQGVPPQLMQLTEFAISSIRDVSGVNMEMLGMREANQPGVLEYQRRQAGITVLQWLFDAFRRYRREQGRIILYYLMNELGDGRLIRIVGDEGEQYVPLIAQADLQYDIIVDEAPTAPNQKERTWQLLSAIMPNIRDVLSPGVILEMLDYSPLPSSIVTKMREAMEKESQSPEAMQQMEAEARALAANISETEANAFRDQAAGMLDQAKVEEMRADMIKTAAEAQRAAADAQQTQVETGLMQMGLR